MRAVLTIRMVDRFVSFALTSSSLFCFLASIKTESSSNWVRAAFLELENRLNTVPGTRVGECNARLDCREIECEDNDTDSEICKNRGCDRVCDGKCENLSRSAGNGDNDRCYCCFNFDNRVKKGPPIYWQDAGNRLRRSDFAAWPNQWVAPCASPSRRYRGLQCWQRASQLSSSHCCNSSVRRLTGKSCWPVARHSS